MTLLHTPPQKAAHDHVVRLPRRLFELLQPPILTLGQASNRITAYVYGNLVVLGALLAMTPGTAVSAAGALTVVAAGASTFIAHWFAELLGHRVATGHSLGRVSLTAARDSLPIVSSAIVPIAIMAVGGWLGWADPAVHLAAALFVCARIGLVGAAAERFRGRPGPKRLALVGVLIAVVAATVAVLKVLVAG